MTTGGLHADATPCQPSSPFPSNVAARAEAEPRTQAAERKERLSTLRRTQQDTPQVAESERAGGGRIQTEFQRRAVRAQRRHSTLISAASLRGWADLGALCLRHIETPWTTEKPILILPYQMPEAGEA